MSVLGDSNRNKEGASSCEGEKLRFLLIWICEHSVELYFVYEGKNVMLCCKYSLVKYRLCIELTIVNVLRTQSNAIEMEGDSLSKPKERSKTNTKWRKW